MSMDAHRFRLLGGCGLYVAWVALVGVAPATAASHRTRNFVVEAPTADQARQVADHAESYRKSIGLAWLGHELPTWSEPCPIRVKITGGEAGGLTTFVFQRGRVTDQKMSVEGRLDRILASSLPHEVTHTIFAAFFGDPMPRWADEGASLLSEDGREHQRHDGIVDDLIRRGGHLPLNRLFVVEEYPSDLMGFYGQGYSISRFLVQMGGRPRFLQFVRDGERKGWDLAARTHYGLANVHELDRAWQSWHRVSVEGRTLARVDRDVTPALVEARTVARPGGQ